jgi:hypothetical protein
MNFDFNTWIRQPSTITGLASAAAGIGAALSQVTTGNEKVDAVVAFVSFILVHLAVDDHSASGVAVKGLAGDVVNLATGNPVEVTKIAADVSDVAVAAKVAGQ